MYVRANVPVVFAKNSLYQIMSVLTLALQSLSVFSQTDITYKFNSCANFDFEQHKRIELPYFCQVCLNVTVYRPTNSVSFDDYQQCIQTYKFCSLSKS